MIGAVIVIVAAIVLGFIWCFCKMSSIQSRMEEESYRLRTVEKRIGNITINIIENI